MCIPLINRLLNIKVNAPLEILYQLIAHEKRRAIYVKPVICLAYLCVPGLCCFHLCCTGQERKLVAERLKIIDAKILQATLAEDQIKALNRIDKVTILYRQILLVKVIASDYASIAQQSFETANSMNYDGMIIILNKKMDDLILNFGISSDVRMQ